ncbi:MAG TPA: DUF4332 domain-containing protein [Micromonosporaceae bacterium]|nr:DUF4332 domain-containing protein [Micromonosporaceae bacterium]
MARTDPSFVELHDPEKVRDPKDAATADKPTSQQVERFYSLVGQPAPSRFTMLGPFAAHEEKLPAVGVYTADDLLRQLKSAWGRRRLRNALGISTLMVKRWRRIAELGARLLRLTDQDVAHLDLLLSLGIDSPDELTRRTKGSELKSLRRNSYLSHVCGSVPAQPGLVWWWAW